MRLIIDTQMFLYYFRGDPRLSHNARTTIDSLANELQLSVASVWEMAIKSSTGKLDLGEAVTDFVSRRLGTYRLGLLAVALDHLAMVARLPFHHRDPFDRLLVAQSLVEGVPIVSSDAVFDAYGVARIW